jgi:DHA3 family macrolide efflux protein-like MFS transporter
MQASTSLMVPKEHLARVQGLNQMLNGGLNIVSAPLGALLLEWLPVQGVLLIDVGTALLAVLPLFLISVPQPVRSQAAEFTAGKTSVWQDFREGWRYAWGWPGLVMIGLMATLINMLLTPAFSLLPILVIRHFNGQAYHLAWMESIQAVGVIAGGLFLGLWGGFRRRVLTSLVGLVFIGIGSMLTGFTPAGAFTLAVVAMFIVGFSLPIANGPLFAAVQAAVAPEMQGRVFTLIGSVSSAMSPLGLLAAGPIADKLGVQTWFILGGIVTILMGVTSLFVPAILNFEESRSGDHKSESVQQPLPAEAVQGD